MGPGYRTWWRVAVEVRSTTALKVPARTASQCGPGLPPRCVRAGFRHPHSWPYRESAYPVDQRGIHGLVRLDHRPQVEVASDSVAIARSEVGANFRRELENPDYRSR
jgi:hypothetical protein